MKIKYPFYFIFSAILFFLPIFFFDKYIFHYDMSLMLYPYIDFAWGLLKKWTLPGWNPFQFCGAPMIATQTGVFYPFFAIGHLLFSSFKFYSISTVFAFFCNSLFTFMFIRQLQISKTAAFFSAIAYSYSGFMTAHHSNIVIITARSLTPLILYFYIKFINNNEHLKYIIFAGITIALQILTTHPQPVFTTAVFLSVFTIYHLFNINNKKKIFIGSVKFIFTAYLIGAGLSAFQLLETYNYSKTTARATETSQTEKYNFMVMRSMPPYNVASLLYPDYLGNPRDNSYFGEEGFDEFTIYSGIITLFLSLIAVFFLYKTNSYVKIFSITGIIFLIMGIGGYTPLFKILYYIPGFNTFRAPARFLLFFTLSMSVLSAYGFEYLINLHNKNEKLKFPVLKKFIILLIFIFIFFSAIFNLFDKKIYTGINTFIKTNIALDKNTQHYLIAKFIKDPRRVDVNFYSNKLERLISTYKKTSVHTLFFLILIYILLFHNMFIKKNKFFKLSIICILFYELLYFSYRNIPLIEKEFFEQTPETVKYLKSRENDFFRIYSWNRGRMYYELKNFEGLNNNFQPYYSLSEFIPESRSTLYNIHGFWGYDTLINKRLVEYRGAIHRGNYNLLKIAGIKYIITDSLISNLTESAPDILNDKVFIYQINDALPLFHIVNNAIIKKPNEILDLISDANFDFKNLTILEKKIEPLEFSDNTDNIIINIKSNTYDKIQLEINNPNDKPVLLLFNETYYDEWRCEINNRPVEILRANYLFKAVIINPGDNDIKFYYAYHSLKTGLIISAVTLIIILLFLFKQKLIVFSKNKSNIYKNEQ